jgi:hypothetical protein
MEEIGDAYHSGAPTVNSRSGLTHIAWLSDRRLLRAWFGVEVVSAAAYVNTGDAGSAGGWGDITLSPVILQWKEQNAGGVRIDQRLVFDFNLPTGEYQQTSGVNLGSNAFSAHTYYAITLFPAKGLETSWRIHYVWNTTNNASSRVTGAYSTQAGQAVHFNATV